MLQGGDHRVPLAHDHVHARRSLVGLGVVGIEHDARLGCAGRFHPETNTLVPLLKAMKRLKEQDPDHYQRFRVRIWEQSDQDDVRARYVRHVAAKTEHALQFELLDTPTEHQMIEAMKTCDALYVSQAVDERSAKSLPMPLFMFLPVRRPVVAVCAGDSTLAAFMQQSGAGYVHTPQDDEGMVATFLKLIGQREQKADTGLRIDERFLRRYSLSEGVVPRVDELLRALPASLRKGPGSGTVLR